ncbi:transcription intermediary factor 1-alpha isoform X3 [Ceratitis capitata]|uniref:E3 ubiquitin-protein ligase TRIM33 n=1 Tax=Ceratitis capitata TaxID=7213 RepID=W8AS25_CERCA|nr:transcription intermediary factor 1-alpha isoform X3 [Ceratitis capitata]
MEFEELEGIAKTDFVPLMPLIKQEQIDTAIPENAVAEQLAGVGNAATATTSSFSASSFGNPCDSAEKRSESSSSASTKFALLKCVWCNQLLGINDRPKLLECLHVSCSQCISTKFSEVDRTMPPLIHCPVCNMASQNEFIIDNQFLIEQCTAAGDNSLADGSSADATKATVTANITCSSCSDNAVATSWCVDCSEYICDSCVQAHQRLKITKDHTIKPKEEANNEQLPGAAGVDKLHMCHLHPQEKLSLFCETCDKLTCRDCQLSDHRDHKYKFAHEIATETRQALKTLVSEINYKRFLLSSATKVIDDRQKQIADRKKDLIKEITAMVVKITNTVNMRGKQLAMRLNEVCDTKMKVLIEKKDALQLLSDNTDHCIEFMENAMEKGSDYAILSSKKSLVRHLQKLKCQRADIPNPEIPVRIQVQLNQVSELQKVISQLGTVIVDGKPYPPTPSPNGPPRQQPSPNMAPPLRPGLPPGLPAGMSPTGPPGGYGPQNGPPIYNNSTQAQQQFNNMQMNRNFAAEGAVRFGAMPPVGMQRQGQPHVSSSTHPQNMDMSLRGLLNNQAAQSPNQAHISFNGPPTYPGGPQGAASPHQQMNTQMRPHFMGGPPGQQHQNYPQNTPGGPNNPNYMNNTARFQGYQRMSSHAQQQAAVAAMSSGGGPGGPCGSQIPSPNAMQRPQIMSNPMQNNLGFHGSQPGYSPGPPQASPQMNSSLSSMHSMAKWHIPQSAQQTNACPQQGPLMQFANGRQTENFKISLKSPNTLKNTTPPNGSSSAHSMQGNSASSLHAASLGLGPAVSILPNVTSTNPKTPSPSTNENAKDFTEPIDKVRDDSINDLIATIAKLDSNGVQVLPEGRTKTTSPQVHSSTDLSNTQEVNTKNDQKDDPNEDWCAVCLDGGELMCCDKCPKVFHQNCHIPAISSLPDESESWQCLLCVNLKDLANNAENTQKAPGELSRLELQIMQRICLELYCQYEQSLQFREPEPPTNTAYYEIVCNPMSLDVIRSRLDPTSPNHYKDIAGFVSDVRLIFKNTYLFYQEDSKTFTNAKYLENFFEEQLSKWLPNFASKTNSNITNGSAQNTHNPNAPSVSNNSASTSSAPSPGLMNLAASGAVASPGTIATMENGRRSCSAAVSGDDDGCTPAKRLRKLTE